MRTIEVVQLLRNLGDLFDEDGDHCVLLEEPVLIEEQAAGRLVVHFLVQLFDAGVVKHFYREWLNVLKSVV